MVVQVGDGGEGGADQGGGVGLVVAAFAADAVEELAAEREVGDEVYWRGGIRRGERGIWCCESFWVYVG